MKSARTMKPPTSARKVTTRSRPNNMSAKDPVNVYCRVRPMQHPSDISCMRILSDTQIAITTPESATNFRNFNNKEIITTFCQVFTPESAQSDVFNTVACPLVENLILGRNSLLFTYGVTGSGKTYTMMGDQQNGGILPRCFDVIFNSIANYQAKKFVFKPDKLNGFDLQTDNDALRERQHEIHAGLMTPRNGRNRIQKQDSDSDSNPMVGREPDETKSLPVDQDSAYAVFVTYVEIYNNAVFDLLEEDRNKVLQPKIVREDSQKNMYVHGVVEVEVKSVEEAFEMFHRGQRRRKVAHTALNTESSRSHSVFTVRLVQAPLDCEGEQVIQDKRVVCISQLSLVDLAGSERTNRTKNTGQRLREAGNINNSLMTLRSCMEILRENQMMQTNKMVPYRESKLTHLFKNYFDGEGQVRMVVCVNPRSEDYDETIHVMKFAEITQEVQTAKPTTVKMDLGFTPGRRHANRIFKEARTRLETEGRLDAAELELDIGLVYTLGEFPKRDLQTPHDEEVIANLVHFLRQRLTKRNQLREDLDKKQTQFRKLLTDMDSEIMALRVENATLRAATSSEKTKSIALQDHVCKTETQVDSLLRKLNDAKAKIERLEDQVKNKDVMLSQRKIDKDKVKQKVVAKIQAVESKAQKEADAKIRQQKEELITQMKKNANKISMVKQILYDNGLNTGPLYSRDGTLTTPNHKIATKAPSTEEPRSRRERIAVANPRHRRSQSADRWIDHQSIPLVPVGTVLQPRLRCRRSINRLLDPKDITDGASKYLLVDQAQDTDGELETMLYKGDILPTSGGGAQVVFNDVELLKQISPTATRKRSGALISQDKEQPEKEYRSSTTDSHSKRFRS